MARLVSSALAAMLATVAVSSAYAGISLQGPRLSGIALQAPKSGRTAVSAVTLVTGETIALGRPSASSAAGRR
jgi:hypothetical protein